MADTSDIEQTAQTNRLDAIGRKRARALQTLDDTITELRPLARELVKNGMRKSEVARRAGISRPTLDAMLNQAQDN